MARWRHLQRGGSTTLTITNSTLSGNSDNGWNFGGAIVNHGITTITGSTFSGNWAADGGAIYNWQGAPLTITNSTFSGNFCNAELGPRWGHQQWRYPEYWKHGLPSWAFRREHLRRPCNLAWLQFEQR